MKKRLFAAAALALISARRLLVPPYVLADRVVLISGGSRGLGLALARVYADHGAKLMLLARDRAELERAAAELRQDDTLVGIVVGDITREEDARRAIAETLDTYGRLDVLVNSAGVIQTGPMPNLTLQDYQDAMNVNFFGALHLMMAARPALATSRGRILNVASVGGKVGVPHLSGYSASKFALVGLGQAWRAELRREGIVLTTACPGLMRTGSARHAIIKGKHRLEYGLFATLDNLPLVSLDAAEAARRMVSAMQRGDAEPVIGGAAEILVRVQQIAPQLTAELLGLGNRLLPSPGRSTSGVPGFAVETTLTQNNPLKRAAEADLNEK
ncbi:SDR family NAD(P)-dependent oxidoreductase [Deinococcus ruber]|uniref:Ketoacyl reductase n=1 Tax=Deinococcus ruber TaxID=1848197 RepID=A0A918CFB9_9DEIO|nr:SDR family NAD(P)-dependent oxidoreductase [Deinococcus ruber]GGR18508.1 ketoacyl reductase [Deinococcus ruber]